MLLKFLRLLFIKQLASIVINISSLNLISVDSVAAVLLNVSCGIFVY